MLTIFDFSFDKNGFYKVQAYLNGSPSFGYQFLIVFRLMKREYINAFIDYDRYKYKKTNKVSKIISKSLLSDYHS